MKKEYTKVPVKIKSADENSLWATMSTDDLDRHGDRVQQNWNLNSFLDNPIVLNGHQYTDTTETIGRVDVLVQNEKSLEGKIRFAIEENPKAKVIFDLYKGGFLNAFSVGFIPGEEENELLELSAVTVPANALALAKAKGLDLDALDDEDVEDAEEEETEPEEGNESEENGDEEAEEEEGDLTDEIMEDTEEEIKAIYKAGRVLSASSKKKVQSAINALQELLEADNKAYDDEEEEVEEDVEEVVVEKVDIKDVIRELHKEISTTKKSNLESKKEKLHKAIRCLEA